MQVCPNNIVCSTRGRRDGICVNCNAVFGKILDIVDEVECPICLEITKCVLQPKCGHPTCIKCFKRCMYGQPDTVEPQFPYSEDIEREWKTGGCDNPEWLAKYPLVSTWNEEWDKWDREKDLKFYRECNLRTCPLCRR